MLRELNREKDENLVRFRTEIVEHTIEMHKIRRQELKQKISMNKVRLGEHQHDGKGKEHWVDGSEVRNLKRKMEEIAKEKEQLERSKRQARRGREGEEAEEWKVSLASQSHFLGREEAQCQEALKKLEDEKSLHAKEYRLLQEE